MCSGADPKTTALFVCLALLAFFTYCRMRAIEAYELRLLGNPELLYSQHRWKRANDVVIAVFRRSFISYAAATLPALMVVFLPDFSWINGAFAVVSLACFAEAVASQIVVRRSRNSLGRGWTVTSSWYIATLAIWEQSVSGNELEFRATEIPDPMRETLPENQLEVRTRAQRDWVRLMPPGLNPYWWSPAPTRALLELLRGQVEVETDM